MATIEVKYKLVFEDNSKTVTSSAQSNLKKMDDATKKYESTSKKAFDNTSRSASNVIKSYAGITIGIGAAFVAFRKLGSAVSESLTLARAQVDSEKRVEAALMSTRHAAGLTSKELFKLSADLQNVTTYGDETINMGTSMLLTFTNIGKNIFPQATETMLNMSKVMGVDLKQSAIQLGKALNDPSIGAVALRRVGVALTEQHMEQIKTYQKLGDIESAQAIILKELETEFGGVARAMANTDSGKIEQAKNRINDLKEVMGKELLPVARDWYELMYDLSKIAIPAAVGGFKTLTATINHLRGVKPFDVSLYEEQVKVWKESAVGGQILQGEVDKLTNKYSDLRVEMSQLSKFSGKRGPLNQEMTIIQGKLKAATDGLKGYTDAKKAEAAITKQMSKAKSTTASTGTTKEELDKWLGEIGPSRKDYDERIQMDLDAQKKMAENATAWGEEAARINWETRKRISEDITAFGEEEARAHWENAQKEKEMLDARAQNYIQFGESIGQAIGSAFTGQADSVKQGLKNVLTVTLNFLEKQTIAAIVGNQLKNFMTLGPIGLFKAAGETALISGIFSAAKAGIQSFENGGVVKQIPGVPSTGDMHIIRANPGERVLTKEEQKQPGKVIKVNIGGTNINIHGNVDNGTVQKINKTLQDRNENLRRQLLKLSDQGRIAGITF